MKYMVCCGIGIIVAMIVITTFEQRVFAQVSRPGNSSNTTLSQSQLEQLERDLNNASKKIIDRLVDAMR